MNYPGQLVIQKTEIRDQLDAIYAGTIIDDGNTLSMDFIAKTQYPVIDMIVYFTTGVQLVLHFGVNL